VRLAGLLVGLVFGVVLSWSGMSDPDVIRGALLFEESYLFLFFASAVLVATVGVRLLRGRRSLLTRERIDWRSTPVQRRHIAGSVLFGTGWALADACPGPIATQLGQGIAWSLFTLAGVVAGIWVFLRRRPSAIDA
jgi:uncharacterized membrane protein YedE/YeeE